jgi:SAM-dependent methyltransferase
LRFLRRIIKKAPGVRLLQGGWPDEARAIIQMAVFRPILTGLDLRGSCLNAGCGEGLFVRFLNSFPGLTRIVHMDVQKPSLPHLPDSRHEIIQGSVTELPFKDEEFDAVFCTEVLEHVVDDTKGFQEISRVLRPGGLLLISTPTPPAPYDPAHVREGYSLNEIRAALTDARVELLKHSFCMHFAMRTLLRTWRWQYEFTGQRKSWMPRAIILALAYCDRLLPFGKPFDIVALGRKIQTIP